MPTVNPYCVSGAGTTATNGTYSYDSGSFNTFMSGYWQHITEANLKLGYGMSGSYEIYDGYTRLYYAASLTGSYTADYGTAPAPTVVSGECVEATTTTTTTTITTITTTTVAPVVIKIKRSSTASSAPTTLELGELGINIADQKVWVGNSGEVPVVLSDYQNTFVYQGDWDLAVNYKKNDVVKRNGVFYMTLHSVANNGPDPETNNEADWQILSNAVGNQGFQGSQGFQGHQGDQGSQGNQGEQGFQGNQGDQGAGNQGYQGSSASSTPILENLQTVSTSKTLTAASNGISLGPITINNSVTVTIGTAQRWIIL